MKTVRQKVTASRSCGVMREAWCVKRWLPRNTHHASRCRAFTLLEIMVVVTIMAIVVLIGIPFMRTAIDGGKGMTKAVKGVQEACGHARALAILRQTTVELCIRPRDGTFHFTEAGGTSITHGARDEDSDTEEVGVRVRGRSRGGRAARGIVAAAVAVATSKEDGGWKDTSTFTLPNAVYIEGLGVNGEDWTEDPEARVRFYPNGTCDEMSVVLLDDQNQRRNIWLEVVTGLPELESDVYKFKAR